MIRPADTRPKLLLVDDEPTNLQVLRQILQDDYRLLFAKDGDKALELAAREAPALVGNGSRKAASAGFGAPGSNSTPTTASSPAGPVCTRCASSG